MTPPVCKNAAGAQHTIGEIRWPPVSNARAAIFRALQSQLEQSQWWSGDYLRAWQLRELRPLLGHAHRHTVFYRRRLDEWGFHPDAELTLERYQALPPLTRAELSDEWAALLANAVPADHGLIIRHASSSAGPALELARTVLTNLIRRSLILREHHWQQRDFGGRLVGISSGATEPDPLALVDSNTWGPPMDVLYQTGPATNFYHRAPDTRQAEVLCARRPNYLIAYPSNVLDLTRYFSEHGLALDDLRDVRTYGEPTAAEVREACERVWRVPATDVYTAREVGFIALQCPQFPHYHVQSESLLVEVLDDRGRACEPGEVGRVVLTDLHNYAMPLIRYAIEDYAELGDPCPCGRGLPVLRRILGRARNRVVLPDGRKLWPDLSRESWSPIPEIHEIQVRQRSLDQIDVSVAIERPLEPREEELLTLALHRALHHPFRLCLSRCERIERLENGKRERFFSDLAGSH